MSQAVEVGGGGGGGGGGSGVNRLTSPEFHHVWVAAWRIVSL